MQNPDGSLTLRKYMLVGTVVFLNKLALAAGACTIAAGTSGRVHSPFVLSRSSSS